MIYKISVYFLLGLAFVSCASNRELKKQIFLSELGYTLVKSDNPADLQAQHFTDHDGNNIFISRLYSDLDSSKAQRFFNSRKNYIQSLFQNDEDPYFSKTNRIDSCIQGLNLDGQTTMSAELDSLSFDLPATSNFAFGQCNPQLEDRQSRITYIYCKKTRSGLEIKQFITKDRKKIPTLQKENLCEIF